MKKQLLGLFALFFFFAINAKEITLNEAKRFAYEYLNASSGHTLKSASIIELEDVGDLFEDEPNPYLKSAQLSEYRDIYAFNINDDEGFILISGDDRTMPVLGYSNNAALELGHMSPSTKAWLEHYREQIRFAKTIALTPSAKIISQWQLHSVCLKSEVLGVDPLIKTKWKQSPYYNDSCPYDTAEQKRALTGCVATAMAQVMNYWEHPAQGRGVHTYYHPKYGALTANFGVTTYDWAAMPDTVKAENEAVATLCHHCGVAVEMDYGVDGSGAWTGAKFYPDQYSATYALQAYFGYDTTAAYIRRSDYTSEQWRATIQDEIDHSRPVIYCGTKEIGGAHAFICDGYDSFGFFHINWGWGGYADGYFLLDILDSRGKGLGPHSFHLYQDAIVNVKPTDKTLSPRSKECPVSYVGDLSISKPVVNYGEGLKVSATIDYKGDESCEALILCGFLPDAYLSSNLKSAISFPVSITLQPGVNTFEYVCPPENYSIMADKYKVGLVFISESNDLHLILPEDYTYYYDELVDLEVVNENSVTLCSEITVNNEKVYATDSLSVSLSVTNENPDAYTGAFTLMLYNSNAELAKVIGTHQIMLSANSSDSICLNYFIDSLGVDAGRYYLGLMHTQDGQVFEVTGAGEYVNPIDLHVVSKPVPDKYEDNDKYSMAYMLSAEYENNIAQVKTDGADIHVANNWDVYTLVLETGYQYQLNIEVLDVYNKSEGDPFTVDARFFYALGRKNELTWGGDATLEEQLHSNGDDTLYVAVNSYYSGELGSYQLKIDVVRSTITSLNKASEEKMISFCPNPCADILRIQGCDDGYDYAVYNLEGQLKLSGWNDAFALDVSSLPRGVYCIQIINKDKQLTQRFIKK